MRRIILAIRTLGHAVKNVISREMHQLRVYLPAGKSQVAYSEGICHVCSLRLLLGNVDLVVGR